MNPTEYEEYMLESLEFDLENEETLRQVAKRNGELFLKLTEPVWEHDMRIHYVLLDLHKNEILGMYPDLETADEDMLERQKGISI